MANVYTTSQLDQIFEEAKRVKLIDSSFDAGGIRKFIDLLKLRELPLIKNRDQKGRFIKVVTNNDILDMIIDLDKKFKND